MKMSIIITLLVIVGVIALGFWIYDRFVNPQVSIDTANYKGTRFPKVRGSNLAGQEFILPTDIKAEFAVVMIAFQQYQQVEINTWIPVARELSDQADNLVYYEFPTIDRLNPAARAFIDGGMRAGIPDPIARATTITLYLDKSSFREVLEIPDEEDIVVMLINRQGDIFWRTEGPATPEGIQGLETAVQSLPLADG
jgi:hypothetical protein